MLIKNFLIVEDEEMMALFLPHAVRRIVPEARIENTRHIDNSADLEQALFENGNPVIYDLIVVRRGVFGAGERGWLSKLVEHTPHPNRVIVRASDLSDEDRRFFNSAGVQIVLTPDADPLIAAIKNALA